MTPTRPAPRTFAAGAAWCCAAALALPLTAVPAASAAPRAADPNACASSDTRVFVRNNGEGVQISAEYWNGSRTDPVYDNNPSTVAWTATSRHVTVLARGGLVPLGGFKTVENAELGLYEDTPIAWDGSIKLKAPAPGSGYTLCGDDPTRDSAPWPS